jgi:hypothetical protein
MKNNLNLITMQLKRIGLISALVALSSAAVPALAAVNVNLEVGVAPPPPREEVIPTAPAGYVWAPGYWDYFQGQYVWRRGHFIEGSPGYRWVPDNWEHRGDVHHFNAGHWDHDPDYHGHPRNDHHH